MSVKVMQPGMQTTIQDTGRYGSQRYGVVVGGAMDNYSLRIANLLVGNEEGEGALEITLVGPKLKFESDQLIAITGGDLYATIDGRKAPMWRPVLIRKGSILKFKSARKGCRAYVSFAGGIDVPEVLGSKSTYIRAAIGGLEGRALQAGDYLSAGEPGEISSVLIRGLNRKKLASAWSINSASLVSLQQQQVLRVMRGTEFDWFDETSKQTLFQQSYAISTEADRMGYRLQGPALQLAEKTELLSEGVTHGTIQVPANGQPIILMADRQTTGGYPKMGQVITADLSHLAQMQPTAKIRFQEVSLVEAEKALLENERIMKQIKTSIWYKALG